MFNDFAVMMSLHVLSTSYYCYISFRHETRQIHCSIYFPSGQDNEFHISLNHGVKNAEMLTGVGVHRDKTLRGRALDNGGNHIGQPVAQGNEV